MNVTWWAKNNDFYSLKNDFRFIKNYLASKRKQYLLGMNHSLFVPAWNELFAHPLFELGSLRKLWKYIIILKYILRRAMKFS